MFDPERERKIGEEIRIVEQFRKEEQLVRQALGDDQLRREGEMVRSVEEVRKLTEPMETLTASLKPLQDALRGATLTKQIQDAIGGGEGMGTLSKQIQVAIGGGGEMGRLTKQVQEAIGATSSRLTDMIRSPTMLTYPELPPIRTMGDHFQELIHAQAESAEASTARRAVLHLEAEIREFENELDDESQGVGIQLVAFGQTTVVHVTLIDHIQPNLIVFIGNLDETGAPVKLIQHMSQLSFMLVRVPRLEPDKPRRPIGFTTTEEDTEEK